ncbi:MAG: hypothetical protein OXU21_08165 [Chloroflexota bacterium]|nr:hypothetical protein [Chloroflexota bacterium]
MGNQAWMNEYRNHCGTGNTIGVPFGLIGPNEFGARTDIFVE